MKISNYTISSVIFGVFLVTSFVPFMHIILLYWNGGLLALAEDMLGIDALDMAIPFNLIMTAIALRLYLASDRTILRIVTGLLTSFFITGMTVFGFEKVFGNLDTGFYALPFVESAVLIGIGLLGIDTIRTTHA